MQQYIYEDRFKGKPRQLLILTVTEGEEYRVFCDSNFLGILKQTLTDDGSESIWLTEYNILKPIAAKIGGFIISCQPA
jgi:hypothetical protein